MLLGRLPTPPPPLLISSPVSASAQAGLSGPWTHGSQSHLRSSASALSSPGTRLCLSSRPAPVLFGQPGVPTAPPPCPTSPRSTASSPSKMLCPFSDHCVFMSVSSHQEGHPSWGRPRVNFTRQCSDQQLAWCSAQSGSSASVWFLCFLIFVFLIYFWLHWVFTAVCGLLIVVASLTVEHGL